MDICPPLQLSGTAQRKFHDSLLLEVIVRPNWKPPAEAKALGFLIYHFENAYWDS